MSKLDWGFQSHVKPTLLISSLFLILFFYYILNEKFRLWYISIAFSLLYIHSLKKNITIKPNINLLIFCTISILTYTLSYYIFDRLEDLPTNKSLRTYKRIVNQYLWFITFLTLPTLFYFYRFTLKTFYTLVFIAVVFTFLYVSYFNYTFNFNRGLLSNFFNPIITYDIGLTSLSILSLLYSFYLKGKKSYIFLLFSLLAMFSLILHGSRGTWLALPFIYSLILLSYYKQQARKCLTLLLAIFIFISINIILPNSPLKSRINHFNNDTSNIQKNSYQNSTGIRLLLWKNGVELFKTKPILGVGLYQIEENNCKLQMQAKIPQCFHHLHSIYFHELAANGLLGLLGLLTTLLLPFIYFIRNFSNTNFRLKLLSLSGTSFVFYFAVCGLTEYYLFFLNTTYLYFLITATLISFIQLEKMKIKRILTKS